VDDIPAARYQVIHRGDRDLHRIKTALCEDKRVCGIPGSELIGSTQRCHASDIHTF
jgi:hypothetical protein